MEAYYHNMPPGSYLETIIDKRQSTAGFKDRMYWHMDQVNGGWCSHSKASILSDIIKKIHAQTIVEIGVWTGKSLLPMAYTLKTLGSGKIYGIDPWSREKSVVGIISAPNREFWEWVDHDAIMNILLNQIHDFQLEAHIELLRCTSEEAPPIQDIDLLHIDGNHSEMTSMFDVQKWVPLVKQGGWIILDDVSWFEEGKYTQAAAMRWLDEHCDRMGLISDVSTWGIWVKR